MKSNAILRIFFLNYFAFQISLFAGQGSPDSEVHDENTAKPGRPQSANRALPVSQKPFFRWQLLEDHFSGGIGRCSATGVDTSDLNVDLSGITQGKGCVQLALTAAHCIEDAAQGFVKKLTESDSARSEELMCRGENSRGLKTEIDVSLPEGRTEAFLISPRNTSSDIALIAIPCSQQLQTFKLADSRGTAPTQMQVFMPMSAAKKKTPELQELKRDLTKTVGSNISPEIHYSANPRDGEYIFNHGQVAISGDSGSPGFIKYAGENSPRLAAVLAGDASGAPISGVRMAAGLKLEGDQANAKANLKADIEKMLTGLKCGSSLKSETGSQTDVAPREEAPTNIAQTDVAQNDNTDLGRGFQDFKPGPTPAQKQQAKENESASATPREIAATPNSPSAPSENCEGGVCQVEPPYKVTQNNGTPQSVPQQAVNPFEPPKLDSGATELTQLGFNGTPELAGNAKEEFNVDDMKFLRSKDGTLVGVDSKGNSKVPRLQELPSGRRDLVYDAHPNSPVKFERASKKEREALRDYYLGMREGDKESWSRFSDEHKEMINGFLNNWDPGSNQQRWEDLFLSRLDLSAEPERNTAAVIPPNPQPEVVRQRQQIADSINRSIKPPKKLTEQPEFQQIEARLGVGDVKKMTSEVLARKKKELGEEIYLTEEAKAQGDEELRLVDQELQRRANIYNNVSEIIKTPIKGLPPLKTILLNGLPRRR